MGFLFVLVFILGIIFVLLPFLETTPPPSAVPAAQARPRPQIFTSNPLTTLVKRIVNALQTEWDKKREKRRLAVARMQGKRKLAPTNYRAALLKTLPSQEDAPGEPIELPQGEDDGNWLIAPQISPEDMGVKGMHEVNTDEELPQSAEMQATEQPLQALPLVSPTEENASFSAQKEPLLLARANTNLQLPKPARYAPEPTETQAPLSETEKAWQELQAIIYPEKKIGETIRKMADIKFALLPDTPKTQREKETFIKEKTEKTIKEFRRLRWDEINRLLESDEPAKPTKDYLGNYFRSAQKEGKPTNPIPVTVYSKDKNGNATATSFEFPSLSPGDLRKIADSPDATPKSETESTGGASRHLLSKVTQWSSQVTQLMNEIIAADSIATRGATTGVKFLGKITPMQRPSLDEEALNAGANISEIPVEPLKNDLSIREDLTAMPPVKKTPLVGTGSEEKNSVFSRLWDYTIKTARDATNGDDNGSNQETSRDSAIQGLSVVVDKQGNYYFNYVWDRNDKTTYRPEEAQAQ